MAGSVIEKSADDLRREIEELNRQQREITERIRDPRGLRKGAAAGVGGRGGGPGITRLPGRGIPQRGVVRRGDALDREDQPLTKKRLLSAIVKVEGEGQGEEEVTEVGKDESEKITEETDAEKHGNQDEEQRAQFQHAFSTGRREIRRGIERGVHEQDSLLAEPLPRVLPIVDDPNIAKRNRRMFGALLGTLEKFRQEDKKLSGSEAYLRRSTSQRRAEQRALEESERLRQQEREHLAGKRKRDLILRARLAAKAEEKQLELLFIQWTEHHSKLCSFLRTKSEPVLFYLPAKPSEETDKLLEARQQDLADWKIRRREELTEYQKHATEEHLAKVEVDIERWQTGANHGHNGTASNPGEEMEDGEGGAEGEEERGIVQDHGWRKSRIVKPLIESAEDDQTESVQEEIQTLDAEAKVEIEGEEKLDRKEESGEGALKDVMGYGSGDDEMEDR